MKVQEAGSKKDSLDCETDKNGIKNKTKWEVAFFFFLRRELGFWFCGSAVWTCTE